MKIQRLTLAASALILSGGLAMAQQQSQQSAPQQQGPVASACRGDIARFCAGMEHGQGEIRACLEDNKEEVSAACNTALETTRGPGSMGQGMGQMGQGMSQGMMGHRMGGGMMDRGMGHGAMHMRIMFILVDADADGAVSLDEVQSAHARIFAHVDADKDDKVTFDEMIAFLRGGASGMPFREDDDND